MPSDEANAQAGAALIDVSVSEARWAGILDSQAIATQAILGSLRVLGPLVQDRCTVSVLFCNDADIREMNAQWRGINKPTNVLAFPLAPEAAAFSPGLLGDIAIAYETCIREAGEQSKSIENHVTHLVVHGFLHLAGFDHENDAEAEEMEARETKILASLGIGNPYA